MEVTETRHEPQILRNADGEILAVGAEEIERYAFAERTKRIGSRQSLAERQAVKTPPAARTALEEES